MIINSLSILFILFSKFFVLIHDYTLCFTGSPHCNFTYYNYISIWLYYIVIHSTSSQRKYISLLSDTIMSEINLLDKDFLQEPYFCLQLWRRGWGFFLLCWPNPPPPPQVLNSHSQKQSELLQFLCIPPMWFTLIHVYGWSSQNLVAKEVNPSPFKAHSIFWSP